MDAPSPTARRNVRIAALAAVVVGIALAKWLGVFELIGEPSRLAKTLVGLGAWGYVAFIIAYAVLQPFGVPGTAFIVAAPLIWPWPIAFALSMVGTMAASVIGFSFSRFVARDWFASKIPARFRKYDEALARRAFTTVFVLRFVFWMPPLLHAFFGVSKVSGWMHFWGSLVGYIVPIFLVSFFGQRLFDWMRNAPVSAWIGLGLVAAVVAFAVWGWQRRRARAGARAQE